MHLAVSVMIVAALQAIASTARVAAAPAAAAHEMPEVSALGCDYLCCGD